MYFCLAPLPLKKPDKIILHIGTKDAPFRDANEMLKCIFDLKQFTLKKTAFVENFTVSANPRNDKTNLNENKNEFFQLLEAA